MPDNEITREEYEQVVLAALSEGAFQAQVLRFLKDQRWLTFVFPFMKMTRAGWPDIVALHERYPGRMLALELKKVGGKPSPAQVVVVGLLAQLPGVYARFLYPNEWPAVRDALIEGTLFDER